MSYSKEDQHIVSLIGFNPEAALESMDNSLFRMHVDTFKSVFAPIMIKGTSDKMFMAWSNLVGGPTAKVNLVDDDNNIVTTVPPLITSKGLIENQEKFNIPSIIRKAIQRSALPGQRDRFLHEILDIDISEISAYSEWIDVFIKVFKDSELTTVVIPDEEPVKEEDSPEDWSFDSEWERTTDVSSNTSPTDDKSFKNWGDM